MDLLICEYIPYIADALPWSAGEADAALLLILPQNGIFDQHTIAAASPHGVVQRPFRAELICAASLVAFSQFRYEKRLRDRVARLDDNLRSIRLVERAKLIVMTDKQLGEAAAYRHLRDSAMQKRVSIVELAEALVRQAELAI